MLCIHICPHICPSTGRLVRSRLEGRDGCPPPRFPVLTFASLVTATGVVRDWIRTRGEKANRTLTR